MISPAVQQRKNVLVVGNTRIGQAVKLYLKTCPGIGKIASLGDETEVDRFDILVGALAGDIGKQSLSLAIKHKKHLVDIADIEPEFYLDRRKRIDSAGITVVPCCGFSPGLLDLILGNETRHPENMESISIKAGTLCPEAFFFPFLWCFEDLIYAHRHGSRQKINHRFKTFSPFEGYAEEAFSGIRAETYFSQSGFDNLLDVYPVRDFTFRVIRPMGFSGFFRFLDQHGFLDKRRFEETKKVLEGRKKDNITLAEITIIRKNGQVRWQVKSEAKKNERLNSMQKITALPPALVAGEIAAGALSGRGLVFMETLGRDERFFKNMIRRIRQAGQVSIRRNEKQRRGHQLLASQGNRPG